MRNYFYFLNTIFVIFFILYSTSFSQWQKTSGPEGGFINTIYTDGSSTVFTSPSYNGIYRSTDNGFHWTASGLASNDITHIFSEGSFVFAYNGNNLFRSGDNGDTWKNLNFSNYINCFTTKGNFIFLGFSGSSISPDTLLRSSDNGNNWEKANSGISTSQINSLASNDNYLFASVNSSVYRSSDNGSSWVQYLVSGLQSNEGFRNMVTIDSIVLGISNSTSGIYRSTNNGINWSKLGFDSTYITSIVKKGNIIFLINSGLVGSIQKGIYRSDDTGETWICENTNLISRDISTIANNSQYIFAGTQFGVSTSSTNGNNWTVTNSGLKNEDMDDLVSLDNNLYASNFGFSDYPGSGIFFSSNYGNSWINDDSGLTTTKIDCLAADKNTHRIYAGTYGGGVFYKDFVNNPWIPVNNGLSELNVVSLAVDSNSIYAGMFLDGIFTSIDGGQNWTNTFGVGRIYKIAVGTNIIYALQASTFGQPKRWIWKSTDKGLTWSNITLYRYPYLINTIIANGNNVFWGNTDGIYRSTNKGVNWVKTMSGIGTSDTNISALSFYNNNIVAGTTSGKVYLSTNNGDSWSTINDGFPNDRYVQCFAVNNNILYAGLFYNSVWRYGGLTNSTIISANVPKEFVLFQNYPNPFNPVTKIKFSIPSNVKSETSNNNPPFTKGGQGGFITLKIYDIIGREISTIINQQLQPGTYEVTFEGSKYSSGVYFYKIETEGFTDVKRMILLK